MAIREQRDGQYVRKEAQSRAEKPHTQKEREIKNGQRRKPQRTLRKRANHRESQK